MKITKPNGIEIDKPLKVTLSKSQIAMFHKQIVYNENINTACQFAGINYRRFKRALDGGQVRQDQRDKLIEFCKILKAA